MKDLNNPKSQDSLAKQIKKVIKSGLLVVAIFTISAVLISPKQTNAAPFDCSAKFFQIINGDLAELNPETGLYTNIGYTGSLRTNAAGYNSQDNYIYAWQTVDPFGGGTTGLVKINSDGTPVSLGVPPSMPTNMNYVSGDFDGQGNLFVYDSVSKIYKINVSAVTATSITTSQSSMPINDLVFINGTLYGLNVNTLFKINSTTGAVTTSPISIAPDPNNPNSVYGAGWTTSDNKLFFSRNSDGKLFEIENYVSSSPTVSLALSGATASGNDGASCPLAANPIETISASNDTGSTKKDTTLTVPSKGVLANDSGKSISVTSYTQPQNGSITINPDGSYTYVPKTGFTGTDTVTYTITDEFGQTKTATLTITVDFTPPPPTVVPPKTGLGGLGIVLLISAILVTAFSSFLMWRKKHNKSITPKDK